MPVKSKMARGGPSKHLRKQDREYNAKQAQARKDRKAQTAGPSNIQDVFEYVTNQEEAKRDARMSKRAQRNDAGDEDIRERTRATGGGGEESSEEGDDEVDRFKQTRPDWDNEDVGVRSEDDEEIDSDEAFGESDEEKYEGWTFGKGSKETAVGSDHDEEEEDDDDEDEDMMDLSKMLDGDDSGEDSESDSNESNEDDEQLQQRMESIVAKSGMKRAADDDDQVTAKGAKRRILKERTEAVPEGEWRAPSRATGSSLLTIDDLMDPLREQGGTTFTSLRDTAKTLKAKRGEVKQGVASKRGGGALQAPLPSIIQDRLDRSAAYDETKEEVQGWQPTIKRIREAEHLSFPLQPDPVVRPSTSLMTSQFKPSNNFEKEIAAMLENEGLNEKQLEEAEELKMNEQGMSAEEIRSRREDLRKMRDLLFREEQKAKRVSKIKSKTYRKIARKQRERDLAKAKEAGLLLDGDVESEKEDREKQERLRAKERATLKHKNTGKWAKNTIGLQGDMPEARNAIEEQLRTGERLRRRIQGQDSEDDDDDDANDDDSEDDEDGEDGTDSGFDELKDLSKKTEAQRIRDEEELQGKKGVWGMKFMQDARNKRAKETQDEIENFQKEMRSLDQEGGSEVDGEQEEEAMQSGTNPGRMVFTSSSAAAAASQHDDEGEEGIIREMSTAPAASSSKGPIVVKDVRQLAPQVGPNNTEANPWLAGKPVIQLSRKKNESIVRKEATSQSRAANKIQKHIAKGSDERKQAENDAQLHIDPEAKMHLQSKQSKKPTTKTKKSKEEVIASLDEQDSEDSLDDEPVAVHGRNNAAAIRQRDLVAEAFAGDDVTTEFEAEKAAMIEAEGPQTIDTTLPGWGSWTGKGVRTNKKRLEEQKKKFTKIIPGLDPTKRKDAKMVNVVINEKKDKKASRYKPSDVPYPYTSRAQYEMAMRNPLGPEWNTRTQHQKLTLPKVLTKPGKAIKPIERLF